MIQSNCQSCGKSWRLPNRDKTYTCKECGGVVDPRDEDAEAVENLAADEWPESPACPKCDELNAPGAAFCESCGAAMSSKSEHRASPARAKAKSNSKSKLDLDSDRRMDIRELGRLKKTILTLRVFYIIGACAYGIALLVLIAAASLGELEVWVIPLFAIIFGLNVLGAARIKTEPFPWAVGLAAVQTLSVASSLLMGQVNPLGIIFLIFYWVAVQRAARVQQILTANPDVSLDRKVRSSGRNAQAGRGRINQMKSGRSSELVIIIGAIVLIGGLGFLIASTLTGGVPKDRISEFEQTWEEGSLEEVNQFLVDGEKGRIAFKLRTALMRRGLLEKRGLLDEPVIELDDDEKNLTTTFGSAHGDFVLEWEKKREVWLISSIKLPPIQPRFAVTDRAALLPPAFVRADAEELTTFYLAEKRKGLAKRLARRFEDRAWSNGAPKVMGIMSDPVKRGRVLVTYQLQTGEQLVTSWEWYGDNWYLRRMRFPK